MTEAPISPLRRRMIEDMTMRKFAPRTQEGYIRAVKGLSAFLGASPRFMNQKSCSCFSQDRIGVFGACNRPSPRQ
jgi:hypothetical protein